VTLKSRIKLLTIDLDDTLWPCKPTIVQAELTSYQWLQKHRPRITERYSMEELRDKRGALMRRQPELFNNLSEARRMHLRELADDTDYDHEWIEQAFQVFLEARQKVAFYADTLPALSELKRHFHLVALTNGNAHFRKVGLGEYFVGQVSAEDVAAAKPDPAMFVEAMQRLQVSETETLHVGDHAIHDVSGARAAGIASVWVNRGGEAWTEADFRADYEVSDLTGLLELLA
jgi:putative hydrolase of the HAD superfamily